MSDNLKVALDRADRYEAFLVDIELTLRRRAETLDDTVNKMHIDSMRPKPKRNPDWDFETLIRYSAYASAARSAHHIARKKITQCLSITTEELTASSAGTSSTPASSASTTKDAHGAMPEQKAKRT